MESEQPEQEEHEAGNLNTRDTKTDLRDENICFKTQDKTSQDTYKKGNTDTRPILILSDSMLRGIIQRKFAPNRYTNKQYVPGGTDEMISHIATMQDTTDYEFVVVHTGTNDIKNKSIDEITRNNQIIMDKIRAKWPNTTTVMSGIISHASDEHKNEVSSKINNNTSQLCMNDYQHNSIFVDNSSITTPRDGTIDQNAFYDEVHLNNRTGTKRLVSNLKEHMGLRGKNRWQTVQQQRRQSRRPERRFQQPEESFAAKFNQPRRVRSNQGNESESLSQFFKLIARWLEPNEQCVN